MQHTIVGAHWTAEVVVDERRVAVVAAVHVGDQVASDVLFDGDSTATSRLVSGRRSSWRSGERVQLFLQIFERVPSPRVRRGRTGSTAVEQCLRGVPPWRGVTEVRPTTVLVALATVRVQRVGVIVARLTAQRRRVVHVLRVVSSTRRRVLRVV